MITILGVVGMVLVSLPWPNQIFGLAVIMAGSMAVIMVLWIVLLRAPSCKLIDSDGSL